MTEVLAEAVIDAVAEEEIASFAMIRGEAVLELPKDLYIPPDAMKVFLEAFEGPLDLLLYLIRKQNLDILDIPIADVTRQYVEYIELMNGLSLELVAEYLLMAAVLAEIKSRMLLPRQVIDEGVEEDPRAELVRRLQEYERFQQAALTLDELPRDERDTFVASVASNHLVFERPLPTVSMQEIARAFMDVLKRAELNAKHAVKLDALSVREKMTLILESLQQEDQVLFTALFCLDEGRLGVVVTFLAMLELLKQGMLEFVQVEAFSPIYLKAKTSSADVHEERELSFT